MLLKERSNKKTRMMNAGFFMVEKLLNDRRKFNKSKRARRMQS
jgi:hypothetical protein